MSFFFLFNNDKTEFFHFKVNRRLVSMKFIFANNYCYLRGGSERVFYDEISMLRGFGHEIALFSRHFNKNIHSEYSEYFASDIEYQNVSLIKKNLGGGKTDLFL